MILEQKIHDLPNFEGVERWVQVQDILIADSINSVIIKATVRYEKNGQDVTANFQYEVGKWVVNNDYYVYVRDAQMNKVENPDFSEVLDEEGNVQNEEDRYLRAPAYDYFKSTLGMGVNLIDMLRSYIQLDAIESKRFDFLKDE